MNPTGNTDISASWVKLTALHYKALYSCVTRLQRKQGRRQVSRERELKRMIKKNKKRGDSTSEVF